MASKERHLEAIVSAAHRNIVEVSAEHPGSANTASLSLLHQPQLGRPLELSSGRGRNSVDYGTVESVSM